MRRSVPKSTPPLRTGPRRRCPRAITETAGIDGIVAAAQDAAQAWATASAQERRGLLRTVAQVLESRRPELLAVMAHEACKVLAEGDSEVCEAIDMAAYYAEQIPGLGVDAMPRPASPAGRGARHAAVELPARDPRRRRAGRSGCG